MLSQNLNFVNKNPRFCSMPRFSQTSPRGSRVGREILFSKRRRTLYGRAENEIKKAKNEGIFSV